MLVKLLFFMVFTGTGLFVLAKSALATLEEGKFHYIVFGGISCAVLVAMGVYALESIG